MSSTPHQYQPPTGNTSSAPSIQPTSQHQPYAIDDFQDQGQLTKSTEQHHLYLQNTILAAALNIIKRLPALHQITTPTAKQLAEAIPFEILGLYSRFLVVFHQPNHSLKLMRKVYYAYLIGRRRRMMMHEDQPHVDANLDPAQSSLLSAVETGSLIISLLRHETHHRLAALKLAPSYRQLRVSWLNNQIALVESEDGRVERVLRLAWRHSDPNANAGMRYATRFWNGRPDTPADKFVAQGMKSRVSRHEFLAEMIREMFPTCKIVLMQSEPLRNFRFASHPGKSPESFRLMRWSMKSNELDLALHLFQSISCYGYVSSLGIPFSYLKRLLDKALYSHPELAMELYQHLHMLGADRLGELFRAVKHKAIEIGDDCLAEYLLKRSDVQDGTCQATRIASFMTGFARRRASPGNVAKTISLFDLIWARWSSLIEKTVCGALSDQIQRLGPINLAQRPELRLQIDRVLRRLDEADMDPTEVVKINKDVMECVEVSKLIGSDQETLMGSQTSEARTEDVPSNEQTEKEDLKIPNAYDDRISSVQKFEDLIQEYVREKRMGRAVEVSKRALEMEIAIPGPVIGQVLNGLVDALAKNDNKARPDSGPPSSAVPAESILLINQAWRALAWKVNPLIRGSDTDVVRAMDQFYQRKE
ncbi:hypothetical protein PCANC_17693 [Puccinia coronata f. sp. avenae]|uniref:Uncharacterized protein n=1 Tax=Puccinia coronata f. sp. avenae TaxID=200324 RepID=A0A2N5U969_9BASI|nr:hypothetical protein PCANC_17693 [Puccinia coronata f. sp. avenae]